MVSTGGSALGTNCHLDCEKKCHPDRSFSSSKRMKSGVEGPSVSCRAPRGGCMWREKTQTEHAAADPPAPSNRRKERVTRLGQC